MVGYRLKMLRKEHQLTQKGLAKIFGVSPKAISFYELEERQPPNELLLQMAKYFNVTTDYLLGQDEKIAPSVHRIPVVKKVAAETPIEAIQEIADWEEISETMGNPCQYFALEVSGDYMYPYILDGSRVIVRKQSEAQNGQVAVVTVGKEDATLKQVSISNVGMTLATFDNKAYLPHSYTLDEIVNLPITIIGIAVEVRTKL